ncbi:lytic transglycosylase domain-containing protein [bacterium]|nr:lytic transglycosylase domain-containing protein [bacterium]
MSAPIGGLGGFAGVERVIRKFYEIRESLEEMQNRLSRVTGPEAEGREPAKITEDQPTFRSALDQARERHSMDGKESVAPRAPASRPMTADATSMEKRLMDTLRRELPKHSVPPDLALAVMQAESNFDPSAVSPKGAIGVMQIMPSTALGLGVDDAADLYEPEINISTGLRHLSDLLSKYGGDERKALAAYNAGPTAVSRYGGVPPFAETETYIRRVFEIRRQLNDRAGSS